MSAEPPTTSASSRSGLQQAAMGGGLILLAAALLYAVWLLRGLFLPVLSGGLAAYLCVPAVRRIRRWGLPRPVAVLLFFGVFLGSLAGIALLVQSLLPQDLRGLRTRVTLQYKLNHAYRGLLGLDSPQGTNLINRLVGDEARRYLSWANHRLSLDEREFRQLQTHFPGFPETLPEEEPVLRYLLANVLAELDGSYPMDDLPPTPSGATPERIWAGSTASLWVITPFVFLFFLVDDGKIRAGLTRALPERFTTTVNELVEEVHEALTHYLRGLLGQAGLIALSYLLLFTLFGMEWRFALLLAPLAALTNPIPVLGPLVGLGAGASYALLSDTVHSPLPFVTEQNFLLWMVLAVGIVKLLDNVLFSPLIVGRSARLHPLALILAIVAASVLFGVPGVLLCVPTLVVLQVVARSVHRHWRALQAASAN